MFDLHNQDIVAVMAMNHERSIVFANEAASRLIGRTIVPGRDRCPDVGNLLHQECVDDHPHCPLTRSEHCALQNTMACDPDSGTEAGHLFEVTCVRLPAHGRASAQVLKTVRPLPNSHEQAMILAVRNRELKDKLNQVTASRDYALKELSLARQAAKERDRKIQAAMLQLQPHFSAVGGLLDSLLRRGTPQQRRRTLLEALEDQVRHIRALVSSALDPGPGD